MIEFVPSEARANALVSKRDCLVEPLSTGNH